MRAYKANMIPGGVTPTINVSQYDNDYAVTVKLIEGAEIYTPPVGATIRVEGTKPDGHGFEYACTYQGNVVTMPIYTQMTVVAGRFPIELVVCQNGLRVGSCNIIFAVEKAPLGEDTDISETVIPDIIAGAQAQADAAAASAASAETAAQELQSLLIHDTASGALASFADGADNIPMQSVVAEITPVQSGTGDPSPTNIRPISGRTGMTVIRCGKNLGEITLSAIADADIGEGSYTLLGLTFSFTKVSDNGVSEIVVNGTPTARVTSVLNRNLLVHIPPGRYILSGCPSGGALNKYRLTCWDNTASATLASDFGSGATFELVEGHNVNFAIDISGSMAGETISNLVFKPMIRPASDSDDAYEPYNGTSFPITWQTEAGTVYGGTLDVVSGVLTVDRAIITLDGSQTILMSQFNRAYVQVADAIQIDPSNQTTEKSVVCDRLKSETWAVLGYSSGNLCCAPLYGRGVAFRDDTKTTTADWTAYFTDNPTQFSYKLATPQTYQLTPTEVRTILGGNTIYTDAGDVSVEYIADTKLYIDNKIAELQALVLEN